MLKSMTTDKKLYNIAFGLALFTIFYNIAEGIISTYIGFEDESLALFGFGSDSFIEVISGLGKDRPGGRSQGRALIRTRIQEY